MALTLYHGHGSPYAWRALLGIEHKRVPYELKVLSFSAGDTRKPDFIAVNPRHQVPTLVDDGFVVWESAVILEYLEERFPAHDGSPALFPGELKQRALVRRIAREADEYLWNEGGQPIAHEVLFNKEAAVEANIVKAVEKLTEELAYFEGLLAADFLAGPLSAADFTAYPYIAYLYRIEFRRPDLKLSALLGPKLKAWKARIEALPYFDKTFPPHWRA